MLGGLFKMTGSGSEQNCKGRLFAVLSALFLAVVFAGNPALADDRAALRKLNCARYQEMVAEAEKRIEEEALSPDLMANNRAFIEAGCLSNLKACPVSALDFEFVNLLTMMTISANMGSTFLPFGCPAHPAQSG